MARGDAKFWDDSKTRRNSITCLFLLSKFNHRVFFYWIILGFFWLVVVGLVGHETFCQEIKLPPINWKVLLVCPTNTTCFGKFCMFCFCSSGVNIFCWLSFWKNNHYFVYFVKQTFLSISKYMHLIKPILNAFIYVRYCYTNI